MTFRPDRYWALLAAVALLQTAALIKIVLDRQTLLKTGREITMAVQPVDPRDLFRGDYVTLGYGLSPVTMSAARNGAPLDGIDRGRPVYVTVHPAANNTWTVTNLAARYPNAVAPDDVVLKGLVQNRWFNSQIETAGAPGARTIGQDNGDIQFSVKYGIESYFVPEGTGKPLEDSVREKKLQAVIAVATDGAAALKGLIIDGERHEDPPLF